MRCRVVLMSSVVYGKRGGDHAVTRLPAKEVLLAMLSVSSDNHSDVVVVHVSGDVDALSVGSLRDELTQAIAGGATRLVADLSEVTFMDSTGLGVLVGRLKAVRMAGGGLHCVVTTERLRKIFYATGLERVLPLYEDVEGAVSSFDPQS